MEKPFTIGILRDITDQYESGDISYSKMVEMLNEIAMKWHNPTISKMETTQTEEAKLDSALFTFSQEGNCVDGGIEILEVRCESSLGIDNDKGCFYVLKTEQWSIESIEELKKIITRISKVVNK